MRDSLVLMGMNHLCFPEGCLDFGQKQRLILLPVSQLRQAPAHYKLVSVLNSPIPAPPPNAACVYTVEATPKHLFGFELCGTHHSRKRTMTSPSAGCCLSNSPSVRAVFVARMVPLKAFLESRKDG